jgi:Transposase DDE domain
MLHESDGMRARRRRETRDPQAERLPHTTARLVTFTVTAVTRSGRTKTTLLRVLITLLDHQAYPAAQIAALHAERWQIEIAFLHLKRTVRGPPPPAARPVPGTGPPGSPGTAAHPQHHRHRIRPRRRIRRTRPRTHPVNRGARPRPVPRRRRHLLPALRTPHRQRRRPAGQPERRDPRPAPPPARTPADIRQNSHRTTNPAHRRSHLHHRHHKSNLPKWDTTQKT